MPASAATTAPLFLLPGLICNEVIWAAQVTALAEFQPTAVSGYGAARSLVAMAEAVLASAPDRISLAGHSMGARVALEMYRLAPQRIERLALLDTGVHPVAPGEKEKRFALLDHGKALGMEALVERWLPPMVHPDRRVDQALMQTLRAMSISAGLVQYENQMTALIGRQEARSLLPRITCPTLIGVGSNDAWAPVAQHEAMAAAIPGAVLVVFEHAGHMAPAETPDQVTDALRLWLQRPLPNWPP
jgi:pimeloyl-ACP methyl ester carboxylesterase